MGNKEISISDNEDELSAMFGRKVDLRTPEDLSKYFRDEVIAAAEVHYIQDSGDNHVYIT